MHSCQIYTKVDAMGPVRSSAIWCEELGRINLVLNFNLQPAGDVFLQGNNISAINSGHNNLIPWNTHDRRKITSNKTEVTELPSSQQFIHNLLNEANDLQRSLFRQ